MPREWILESLISGHHHCKLYWLKKLIVVNVIGGGRVFVLSIMIIVILEHVQLSYGCAGVVVVLIKVLSAPTCYFYYINAPLMSLHLVMEEIE